MIEKISILMLVASVAAYFVKGMCGFANTLVFSTILGFQNNNIAITPLELLVGYPSNILIAWKKRKSVSLKIWLPLAVLVILGSIPGIFFLKLGDTRIVKVIFGFVVAGIGLEMFFREYQKKKNKTSPVVLGIIGLISGALCGLFGIGALLAAYVSRTTEDNNSFQGNLCMVFIVDNTFRLILYSCTGIITFAVVKTALVMLPCMAVGLGLGMFLQGKLNEKIVRKIVMILLILSGISLIVSNLK